MNVQTVTVKHEGRTTTVRAYGNGQLRTLDNFRNDGSGRHMAKAIALVANQDGTYSPAI